VVYVPLYLSKSLYLTAVLYAVFLCMAVLGLLAWRSAWLKNRPVQQPAPRGLEAPA
jgi:nicotinamide mononucleotide transporter